MRLIRPLVAKYAPTEFGKKRLEFLLKHPMLDSNEIKDRQDAVRELVENTELQKAFTDVYATVNAVKADQLREIFLEENPRIFANPALEIFQPFIYALIGGGLASGLPVGTMVGAGLQMGVISSMANSRVVGPWRHQHSLYKALLEAIQKLQTALDSVQSKNLVQLRTLLQSINQRSNVQRMNKSMRSLVTSGYSRLLDLTSTSNITLRRLQSRIQQSDQELAILFGVFGELEAYYALSRLALSQPDLYIAPTILPNDAPSQLMVRDGHHPFLITQPELTSVANDVNLSVNGNTQFYLITGVNAGGKSTYERMIAVNEILAMIGSFVPARVYRTTPKVVLTNMAVNDSVEDRASFFTAQCARIAAIYQQLERNPGALVIMDEVMTGTSPEEHTALEQAIIEDIISQGFLGVLATHNRQLVRLESEISNLRNIHLPNDGANRFRVQPGPSQVRNALSIAQQQGIPNRIVDRARQLLIQNGIYGQ